MKSKSLYVIIFFLVILNLILLFRGRNLNKKPFLQNTDISLYTKQKSLPSVKVVNRAGFITSIERLIDTSGLTLLIFFTPSDCPSCFSEKELWKRVKESGLARTAAIACNSDPKEFWKWVDATGFDIPIYLDSTFASIDTLNLSTTPMKILVNNSGDIVWADPPRLDPYAVRSFFDELSYYIETKVSN